MTKQSSTAARVYGKRDDFTKRTKELIAKRVNYVCSFPGCGQPTAGPHTDDSKALNVGEAAHITAACSGGPRFDASLSTKERRSYKNGIWMCRHHGVLVDNDKNKYPVSELRKWKIKAEKLALENIERKPARTPNAGASEQKIFSKREVEEFEYIFSKLNSLIDVSTTYLGEYPKGSTWRDHWLVRVSMLELILITFNLAAPRFATYELEGQTIEVLGGGAKLEFCLDRNSFFGGITQEFFEKSLCKFGLIRRIRNGYEFNFTDKMQRFVYWIEYNERFLTQSIAYKRDEA